VGGQRAQELERAAEATLRIRMQRLVEDLEPRGREARAELRGGGSLAAQDCTGSA
jgi:hypothetical protein